MLSETTIHKKCLCELGLRVEKIAKKDLKVLFSIYSENCAPCPCMYRKYTIYSLHVVIVMQSKNISIFF